MPFNSPQINTNRKQLRNRNAWLILLLTLAIMVVISAFYAFQKLYFRLAYPPPTSGNTQTLHKITGIGRDFVYDLSGSEASGYGNAMNLFDENADPANGYAPTANTSPLPWVRPYLFYPNGKGLRIVIDLQSIHNLNYIYYYDRSPVGDSIWFYSGNMQNWKLEKACTTIGSPAAWGWRSFPVNANTRFLMLRLNSPKADITELVLYGNQLEKNENQAKEPLTGPLSRPSLQEFAGTNTYDYVPPALLKYFPKIRLYRMMDYFDRDTVQQYPKNRISLNHDGLPVGKQFSDYLDSLHLQSGNELWMSIRGLPLSQQKKGYKEQEKPVTGPKMDSENPLSYGRHARTYWNIAAIFGNKKQDTAQIDVTDIPKRTGLHSMHRIENGNEEDGWWSNFYWTPMDYFAASSADFDGAEGKLGPKTGIKQADPGFQLMTSGMIQLDTNRVRTLKFLCEQLRSDKKFIWEGGVQYHYYSNDGIMAIHEAGKGISPEEDSLRAKLSRVRAFHDRILPGIPLILGENGYDRKQSSWQKTPLLPGYNEGQSQGIMVIRSMLAVFMAGFDGYNQFMMRSASNDENAGGTFATSGMIGGPANPVIYPAWYYWATVMQNLGSFKPDGVVSETGPVWIYKLRSSSNSSQIAYILFSPTHNGTLIKNYRLKPEQNGYQQFDEIVLKDKSVNGLKITRQLEDGFIRLNIGESPTIVILK